ncbi:MAG TPA: hypothetical protein VGK31_01690 [Thermoanaerobaculia bacterium]|jgi:hypothetical protein
MRSRGPNIPDGAWQILVEVSATQARLIVLVVTPRPHCKRALLGHDFFEVPNQCPADAVAAMLCRSNERMNFPGPEYIRIPPIHPITEPDASTGYAADPAFAQRFESLLTSRVEILLVVSPVAESIVKQRGRAIH